MKTTFADLYRGELSVWVEDHLTHAVLTAVWTAPRINVLVAAGKEGVRHMVNAAAPRHTAVVYGLLDRDFDEDDEARWEQPERRLLRFPAHEFENLLLDFDLLSELSGRCSADEIRACAKERAERLLWWMSCKAVLRRVRADLADNFLSDPPQPGPNIDERGEALQHLQSRHFWERQGKAVQRWTPATIEAALDECARHFKCELVTDAWLRSFSGKELLRHLRSQVRGHARSVKPPTEAGNLGPFLRVELVSGWVRMPRKGDSFVAGLIGSPWGAEAQHGTQAVRGVHRKAQKRLALEAHERRPLLPASAA